MIDRHRSARAAATPDGGVAGGAEPGADSDAPLDEMSALAELAELGRTLGVRGGPEACARLLSASRLATLTNQIGMATGRRTPRLPQQRREFVAAWAVSAQARPQQERRQIT